MMLANDAGRMANNGITFAANFLRRQPNVCRVSLREAVREALRLQSVLIAQSFYRIDDEQMQEDIAMLLFGIVESKIDEIVDFAEREVFAAMAVSSVKH